MTSNKRRQMLIKHLKAVIQGVMMLLFVEIKTRPANLYRMLMPISSTVMAWLSTKIGDPDLACLFITDEQKKRKK
jgi:hypothetical protein